LADDKAWPALVITSGDRMSSEYEDPVSALLDDFSPIAVQDLAELPLPPGGLWDPTYPPPPEPPPAPMRWRVFFSTADDRDNAARALAEAHPDLECRAEEVSDEDWAARSQRALKPVTAGDFIVAPPWDVPNAPERRIVVVIDPSRGFGTGHHASTRLCLRALSEIDVTGARVLDLGTGSGVLAMAATLKGAHTVVAVDVDADAIESARQSAALNPRVPTINWLIADFRDRGWDALSGGPFDVVLANLTGGMLIASAARIRELMRSGGALICSGFDDQERPNVEAALDLEARASFVEDNWVGLTLRRG
jgi:ribosomal protein L11 methyltransferase